MHRPPRTSRDPPFKIAPNMRANKKCGNSRNFSIRASANPHRGAVGANPSGGKVSNCTVLPGRAGPHLSKLLQICEPTKIAGIPAIFVGSHIWSNFERWGPARPGRTVQLETFPPEGLAPTAPRCGFAEALMEKLREFPHFLLARIFGAILKGGSLLVLGGRCNWRPPRPKDCSQQRHDADSRKP